MYVFLRKRIHYLHIYMIIKTIPITKIQRKQSKFNYASNNEFTLVIKNIII